MGKDSAVATVAGVDATDDAADANDDVDDGSGDATADDGRTLTAAGFPFSANLAMDAWRSQRFDDSSGVEDAEDDTEMDGF